MKFEPILIINGEPNSIFSEILFKSLKSLKTKNPLIIISSYKLIKLQMKDLKYNFKIKLIDAENIKQNKLDNKSINLINVEFDQNRAFDKISKKSRTTYAQWCERHGIKWAAVHAIPIDWLI